MGVRNYILKAVFPTLLLASIVTMPTVADAATLGGVIKNTIVNSEGLPAILPAMAYLFGIVIGLLSIMKMYEHVLYPDRVPIWDSLKRALAAGGFFALPMVVESTYNTLALGITSVSLTSWNISSTSISGTGLDAMMAKLTKDLISPMANLISNFVYLAGIILIMIGIMRQLKSMQDGVKGPGGIGTIMTFLVGGALLSIWPMLGAWSETMFGSSTVLTHGTLKYTAGMTADEVKHVHAVISSILGFMMIIGWVSFVRGFFIIRAVSEGESNASLMAGLTHLFGGALAVNLGPLLNAVQSTLGIATYGILFT